MTAHGLSPPVTPLNVLESRLAEPEKSAQCGRLAQQYRAFALVGAQPLPALGGR